MELVPEELRRNSAKRREWYCHCDCGNDIIIEQRNLLSNYREGTRSCGCIRVKQHFIKTSKIKGLTLEYLDSFDNYEKFVFIHKAFLANTSLISTLDTEQYKEYIEYFYYQKEFNYLYNYWNQTKISNTFYDLAKPSLDHIIPKSKGGTDDLRNLQFLSVFENLSKRDMTMQEWKIFKERTNTHSNLFIDELIKGGGPNNYENNLSGFAS